MKQNPFGIFKKKKTKISISKDVVDKIISNSKVLSKKDLGFVVEKVLVNNLDVLRKEANSFIEEKYNLSEITKHLKRSKQNPLYFRKVMNSLKLSKRKFYQRLKIIKALYGNSNSFKWIIKRGKFVKKEAA